MSGESKEKLGEILESIDEILNEINEPNNNCSVTPKEDTLKENPQNNGVKNLEYSEQTGPQEPTKNNEHIFNNKNQGSYKEDLQNNHLKNLEYSEQTGPQEPTKSNETSENIDNSNGDYEDKKMNKTNENSTSQKEKQDTKTTNIKSSNNSNKKESLTKKASSLFKKLKFNKNKKVEDIFSSTQKIVKLTTTNPLDEPYEIIKEKQSTQLNQSTTIKNNFEPKKKKQNKIKKPKTFNLLGSNTQDLEYIKSSNIKDYSSVDDVKAIRKELNKNVKSIMMQAITIFFLMLLSVTSTVLFNINPHIIPKLDISLINIIYLAINLVTLMLSMVVCHDTIYNSICSLFKKKVLADLPITLACVACLIQVSLTFIYLNKPIYPSLHIYSSLGIIGLFLNLLGKLCVASRIRDNFRFLASSPQNHCVKSYDDEKFLQDVSEKLKIKSPLIAYYRKTNFVSNFLKYSNLPDPSQNFTAYITPIFCVLSLLVGVCTLFISKSLIYGVSSLALSLCMGTPFACLLSVNIPIKRTCKKALKSQAMITGFSAIRNFAETNAIMIDCKELYPKGSIELQGIKTFGGKRLDEAILSATSLICRFGGPLSSNFKQIIQGRLNILPKVDGEFYVEGQGLVGWVNGQRVLIGNRLLLKSHGVEPPTNSYESPYLKDGYHLTYFATGGQLVAMFILRYEPNESLKKQLQLIENNDVKFIIRSVDPNITAEMIAKDFGISFSSIQIMSDSQSTLYKEFTDISLPESHSGIVTRGKFSSFCRAVSSCLCAKNNVVLAITTQIIALILGFSIVTLITFYAGVDQVSELSLIVYTIFWSLASIIPGYALKS